MKQLTAKEEKGYMDGEKGCPPHMSIEAGAGWGQSPIWHTC